MLGKLVRGGGQFVGPGFDGFLVGPARGFLGFLDGGFDLLFFGGVDLVTVILQ
jgi:hypothetical protein